LRANFVLSGVATGIRRNMTMTIALVLSTAIMLAFAGAAILADREITHFKHNYEGQLNVSIFLCTKPILPPAKDAPCQARYTDAEQQAIAQKLAKDPLVASAKFISEKDAIVNARKTYEPKVRSLLTVGDLPASFTVHLRDLRTDYQPFRAAYVHMPGVGGVQNQSQALKTLLDGIDGIKLFSILIAAVVLVASILLIANTIQVAAAQRKNETSIMRLVGASRWMTEMPFMLETVIATFVGGLISIGLIWLGKIIVLNNILKVPVERNVIPDLGTNDILVAGGLGMIGGLILAALTAFATLRLYVRL
jgi:cell division transport system permease protein